MTATDVLIIEDEKDIANLLADFLKQKGYVVSVANDGLKGLSLFEKYGARLVVLDIMLPGADGFSILSKIREYGNTPVLIASAKDSKEDKLNGILGGADDYIDKPYDIDILLAKIDGIFKRRLDTDEVSVGEIKADKVGKVIYFQGKPIETTVKEYELMLLFLENPGKALSKEFLFREVWGSDSESEAQTLTVHIKWLRDKLEKAPKNPTYLKTVWGVGYKLEDGSLVE